jgi:hypothetical protein
MAVTGQFGEKSLPILVSRHPSLIHDLSLDRVVGGDLGSLALRVMFSKLVYRVILSIAQFLSGRYSATPIYNYLLYRSYATGFLRARSNRTQAKQ